MVAKSKLSPEVTTEFEAVIEPREQSHQYRHAAKSGQPQILNRAKPSKDSSNRSGNDADAIDTNDSIANDQVDHRSDDDRVVDVLMEQIVVSARGHGTVHFQATGPDNTMLNTMLIAHDLDPDFLHAVEQARVNQIPLRMQLEGTGQKTFFFGCLIYALDHGVEVFMTTDLIESKTERGLDFDLTTARFEYLTPYDLFLVHLKHRNFANNVENAWLRHSATELKLNGYRNNRDEIAACLWYALDYAVPVLVTT